MRAEPVTVEGTALPAWTAWLGPAPHVHLAEAPCADYAEFEACTPTPGSSRTA